MFYFCQGKREKKSSKKSKKAAAAATGDDVPTENASAAAGGPAAELFDLDIGTQQKQPATRFQLLAEDDSLKMVYPCVNKVVVAVL